MRRRKEKRKREWGKEASRYRGEGKGEEKD
jgi:hypothetical protein